MATIASEHMGESCGYKVAMRRVTRSLPTVGRVLFVNGAIATATTVRWAERGLARYELTAFDFPNVGRSRLHNPGIGVVPKEKETEIIIDLVRRYEPDHIISVSWGGTATLLALREADLGLQSAIVSSYSLGVTERLMQLGARLSALVGLGRTVEAAEALVGELGENLPAGYKRLYTEYFLSLDDEQLEYALAQIRYVMAQRVDQYLESLRCIETRVMFVNGAADRFTPPEAIEPIRHYLRQASFQIVPGAGHFLANEGRSAYEHVCRIADDFLLQTGGTLSAGAA